MNRVMLSITRCPPALCEHRYYGLSVSDLAAVEVYAFISRMTCKAEPEKPLYSKHCDFCLLFVTARGKSAEDKRTAEDRFNNETTSTLLPGMNVVS